LGVGYRVWGVVKIVRRQEAGGRRQEVLKEAE